MIIKCPECGHSISDQAAVCPSCGIQIAGKITRCPDCGEVIFKEQPICPNCRCVINGAQAAAQEPSTAPVAPPPPPSPKPSEPSSRTVRRRRAGAVALVVAFAIALIVVFLGLYFMKEQEQQQEQQAYENALRSDEPLILQNFLDMYAAAPLAHRDSIKQHLAALKKVDTDWTDALVNNSKFGYERFLKLHPNSIHSVEASIKIDSLDWLAATQADTPEAYQLYIDNHEDGAYYDEARANRERLEACKVTPEDRTVVTQVLTAFFTALAQGDTEALGSTVAPVLTSFLHRQNATLADVCQYMERLHEGDITRMEFTPAGDWDISKTPMDEMRFTYTVNFSVAQHIERRDTERETGAVYKVTACVSPEARITELNMKRSVQESKDNLAQ